MPKVMWLKKRKEGTSSSDLVDHHETRQSVLATNLFVESDFAPIEHVRKYFRPVTNLYSLPRVPF